MQAAEDPWAAPDLDQAPLPLENKPKPAPVYVSVLIHASLLPVLAMRYTFAEAVLISDLGQGHRVAEATVPSQRR